MGLDFIKNYGGCRVEQYDAQFPFVEEETDEDLEQIPENVNLNYEVRPRAVDWEPINLNTSPKWRPSKWSERPTHFIDGKDVGETIASVRSPSGQLVPIRLSQIGSIAMRVENGECRREFEVVDRVVSMAVDLFPWTEVESFAAALQDNGFRLLTVRPPGGIASYDFETMRKRTNEKSNTEMKALEGYAFSHGSGEPTVIDGLLQSRTRDFDIDKSPVFGVIKTQRQNYLHIKGIQVLYGLEVGQRTPVFNISKGWCDVISWFVRLSGSGGTTPTTGIVRVEASKVWFEKHHKHDWDFVDKLSRTIYEYRCRERSYGRAAISLHPIVRAEESLGSLFQPLSILSNRFYRLTHL
ncbi:hypothetical protein [Mastigocoleus testarum]|uniref:Uncharacterized protein n=1 Tax=Mastigocoleus testarum BC008 TaxID=371196 RepID=A0A0V7ZUN1_9CYAN|nr:hypothetical protein [Mastigocoleus testarum]KST68010.1 hypothetical protein BC008_32010 [Mastigocoleus testarum BC008]KST68365.1 hypothetical protein BC008_33115 [Mastigocoleus testarum BC008]